MGNLTSTLTMRLINGVSGAAAKIRGDLSGLDAAARRSQKGFGKGGVAGFMAGGGQMLATAAGGYVAAGTVKQAYLDSAALERRLTMIRMTADASAAEAQAAKAAIYGVATEAALPVEKVVQGLESLVAAGRSLPDAMAFLPSVGRSAAVAGADVLDMAKSADALGVSLGISSERMQEAFDKMITAGRLGKFEAKDMASSMASILPLAASRGFKGMEGLERIVSYLQAIRQGTGSSEEAADSFRDMLGKISTDETVKKFKKFGIDVKKEMAEVRKNGGNEFDRMSELIQRAMQKGAQVTDLFADIQAYRGWLAFNQALGTTPGLLAKVRAGAGATKAGLADVTTDAQAGIDRLSNSWNHFLTALGKTVDKAGASTFLSATAKEMEALSEMLDHIQKGEYAKGAEKMRQILSGRSPEEDRTENSRRAARGALAREEDQTRAKRITELRALEAEVEAAIAGAAGEPGSASTARRLATLRGNLTEIRQLIADAQALAGTGNTAASNRAVTDLTPELPKGPTGVPLAAMAPADRRPAGSPTSAANAYAAYRRDQIKAPDATMGVEIDDAAATAAAAKVAARVQEYLNQHPPIIRLRVEMPSIPGGSLAPPGNYGDNGGRR